MSTGTIARLTFREASSRKILWAALLLGTLFLIVYGVGMYLIRQEMVDSMSPSRLEIVQRQMGNFMTMAGLYSVNFLTVMMTVLTSVDTIPGEIASGTIHTLVSKPLRRWEILVGKWLGYSGLLSAYLLMMAGGVLLIGWLINGYIPSGWPRGLGLMWMNSMMILCLSLLGGTYLSTLANGVMVFGLFGIAFVGGWIEQIGAILENQTAINVGIISSLILPSESLWRRAAYEMQTSLASMTGGLTPFSSVSVPSVVMIFYAVAYAAICILLALRQFNRRDL